MDYRETGEDRKRKARDVVHISDRDIQNKGTVRKSSRNSKLCQYVAISKKGYIPYDHDKRNQDAVICRECLRTGIKNAEQVIIHFFGVADGHGVVGHYVSNFVTQELPIECENRLLKIKHVEELNDNRISDILHDSIMRVSDRLEKSDIEIEHSGTTLCCSLIYDNMIYTANVGDSQAMIVQMKSDGIRSVVDLNELHKPESKKEKRRIERYGGVVAKLPDLPFEDAGPYRVWNKDMTGPGLAMSRSLGDGEAHDLGVSSVPTIDARPLSPDCKYICWGSDGVFEFLSTDAVAKIILKHDTMKKIAEQIVNEAVKWWRKEDEVVDDISCVLLKLPDP